MLDGSHDCRAVAGSWKAVQLLCRKMNVLCKEIALSCRFFALIGIFRTLFYGGMLL